MLKNKTYKRQCWSRCHSQPSDSLCIPVCVFACVHVLIKIISHSGMSSPDAPLPSPWHELRSYGNCSVFLITRWGSHRMKLHHGDRQRGKDLVLEHKGLDASEDPEEDQQHAHVLDPGPLDGLPEPGSVGGEGREVKAHSAWVNITLINGGS